MTNDSLLPCMSTSDGFAFRLDEKMEGDRGFGVRVDKSIVNFSFFFFKKPRYDEHSQPAYATRIISTKKRKIS